MDFGRVGELCGQLSHCPPKDIGVFAVVHDGSPCREGV
jgi:hypothetical protein